jgi:hypothetical protein
MKRWIIGCIAICMIGGEVSDDAWLKVMFGTSGLILLAWWWSIERTERKALARKSAQGAEE